LTRKDDLHDIGRAEGLSLVVLSCDAYADIWPTFFALLSRNWPDCPFHVYLGTNHLTCAEPSVETIQTGDDQGWADSARRVVESVETPYVLLLLEDFLLRRTVDSEAVIGRFRDLRRLRGGYLRLKPFPKPDVPLARFPKVGEIRPGAPWRAALQAAIWKRDTFLDLLVKEETAWEMEVFGSRRSDLLEEGFYSVWRPALDYVAGVTLGEWTPRGVAVCREQGVLPDLGARPMAAADDNLTRSLNRAANHAANLIPWRVRERMLYALRSTGLRQPKPMPGRSASRQRRTDPDASFKRAAGDDGADR
jgi:hypothetical protein